jgi:hypothetical protein
MPSAFCIDGIQEHLRRLNKAQHERERQEKALEPRSYHKWKYGVTIPNKNPMGEGSFYKNPDENLKKSVSYSITRSKSPRKKDIDLRRKNRKKNADHFRK